jgi:hypothetical protein
MAAPENLLASLGTWQGTSQLRLAWPGKPEEIFESESTLSLENAPGGAWIDAVYTWSHDGEPQHGRMMLACSEEGAQTMAWMDSWHQSGGPMRLAGEEGAVFSCTGSYGEMEGAEPWGWRISLEPGSDILRLKMVNISPDGEEVWAVSADYRRA